MREQTFFDYFDALINLKHQTHCILYTYGTSTTTVSDNRRAAVYSGTLEI